MNHQPLDPNETETSGRDIDLRHTELAEQRWDRARSKALAEAEGIVFSDQHWQVIVFLRKYYLEHGLPINARTTAKALSGHFYHEGGSKYLRRLFSGGPVSQGSRLANLRTRHLPPMRLSVPVIDGSCPRRAHACLAMYCVDARNHKTV